MACDECSTLGFGFCWQIRQNIGMYLPMPIICCSILYLVVSTAFGLTGRASVRNFSSIALREEKRREEKRREEKRREEVTGDLESARFL